MSFYRHLALINDNQLFFPSQLLFTEQTNQIGTVSYKTVKINVHDVLRTGNFSFENPKTRLGP